MRLILLPVLIQICCCASVSAQQLPLFSQYREHVSVINPAAIAMGYHLYGQTSTLALSARQQWVGKEGAPRTQVVQWNAINENSGNIRPIYGTHVLNDVAGRVANTGVYGRIGGIVPFNGDHPQSGGFAAGISLGVVQYRVDLNGVIARDDGDAIIENVNAQQRIFPDAGFGMYAWKELGINNNYVTGGFSIPQVLNLDVRFRNGANNDFNLNRVRHYYGHLGWVRGRRQEGALLEVNSWYKYVPNSPFHFDMNARYQMGYNFWLGAGYGTSSTLHIETGVILGADSNFKIGYSFDMHSSDKIQAFGQSHELNLSYALKYSN